MKVWIGIDNGTSGGIGIIREDGTYELHHTPVHKEANYTKTKQFLNRVTGKELESILKFYPQAKVVIERPMVNPARFRATISAVRCLEATLIVLELLGLSYEYIDSKTWQTVLLPAGCEKEELKVASMSVGKRLFPKANYKGFKDADALLIAEWARRQDK